MKTLYFFLLLALFAVGRATAQPDYTAAIAQRKQAIDSIVKSEKEHLRIQLKEIDKLMEANKLSQQEGRKRKYMAAKETSERIHKKTRAEVEKISESVQQLKQLRQDELEAVKANVFSPPLDTMAVPKDTLSKKQTDSIVQNMEKVFREKRKKYFFEDKQDDTKRTHEAVVFAMGFHNLQSANSWENPHFRWWGSKSVEVGYQWNTRLFKNANGVHLLYGLSWKMDKLKMQQASYFVENGDRTEIKPYPKEVLKSKFKTNYLIVPLTIEFDFSSPYQIEEQTYYPAQSAFRLGIGAYAGVLVSSKQKIKYREAGNEVKEVTRGDFNLNPWTFGLSAHIGYKTFAFYARYSMVPLFQHNSVDEYPFSVGIRFEFL